MKTSLTKSDLIESNDFLEDLWKWFDHVKVEIESLKWLYKSKINSILICLTDIFIRVYSNWTFTDKLRPIDTFINEEIFKERQDIFYNNAVINCIKYIKQEILELLSKMGNEDDDFIFVTSITHKGFLTWWNLNI